MLPWLLVVALVSCSTDGRTLAPASPTQNESVAVAPTQTVVAAEETFAVRGAWTDGTDIDLAYTCYGDAVSPPIEIVAQPSGTVTLAVLLTDTASPEDVLWVMANIAGGTVAIGAGVLPPDVIVATNSDGNPGYRPPCPSTGERRQYVLTLFALDGVIDPTEVTSTDGTVDADTLLTAVERRTFDLVESTFFVQAP
jgi:phosphatidylethanolamine-binding protein (PEBP) family uncharacterized protein